MKVIKLTESQFNRLIRENAPFIDGSDDTKTYNNSEVSVTSNVPNEDGEEINGEPTNTDNISHTLTAQNWWYNNGLRTR